MQQAASGPRRPSAWTRRYGAKGFVLGLMLALVAAVLLALFAGDWQGGGSKEGGGGAATTAPAVSDAAPTASTNKGSSTTTTEGSEPGPGIIPPPPGPTATTVVPRPPSSSTPSLQQAVDLAGLVPGVKQQQQQQQEGGGEGDGPSTCTAETTEELIEALQGPSSSPCELVLLTGTHYTIDTMIEVRGVSVSIRGDADTLPYLDCQEAIRCFKIGEGGYLDVRYVRIAPGEGFVRNRGEVAHLDEEDVEEVKRENFGPNKVVEVRGGGVLFDTGALGGLFVGVVWWNVQDTAEEVEDAIYLTMVGTGSRGYGTYAFIAAGAVRFVSCLFILSNVFSPGNDNINVGGDVLVLGGYVEFTACTWVETIIFGNQMGAGVNVAVMGGVAIFTGVYFQQNYVGIVLAAAGQCFLVAGGVMVITGSAFTLFGALVLLAGTGDFTVLNGVLVSTGNTIDYVYGLFAAYAAGIDFTVGSGLMILTGTSSNQWLAITYQSFQGGLACVGAGEFLSYGSPFTLWGAVLGETGLGNVAAVSSGIGAFVGSPVVDVGAVAVTLTVGAYINVQSGLFILIGTPLLEYTAVDFFGGVGGSVFVGAGSAVMGYSPSIEVIPVVNKHKDFYIQGICEPSLGAWAGDSPFFVGGGGDCDPYDVQEEAATVGLQVSEMESVRLDLSQEEARQALLAVMPDQDMLQATSRLQALFMAADPPLTELEESEEPLPLLLKPPPLRVSPATIHVGPGIKEGQCRACGAANLTGAGAVNCDVEQTCSSSTSSLLLPAEPALLLGAKDSNVSVAEAASRDQYVIMADLQLSASTTGASLAVDSAMVADAFVRAVTTMEQDQGKPRDAGRRRLLPEDADEKLSLRVKAFGVPSDPYLALFQPDWPDNNSTAPPQPSQTFKLVSVMDDRVRSRALIDALKQEEEAVQGEGGALLQSLTAYLQEQQQQQQEQQGLLIEARLSFDRLIFVPGVRASPLLLDDDAMASAGEGGSSNASSSSSGCSVRLTEASTGETVTTLVLQREKAYSLALEGFGAAQLIRVELLVSPSDPDSLSLSWPIATAVTDLQGDARVRIDLARALLPSGPFMLQASSLLPGQCSAQTPALAMGRRRH